MVVLDVPAHWPTARPFDFAGIPLLDVDVASAVSAIEAAAREGTPQGIHLCNAYTLSLALRNTRYRAAFDHADSINLPDGTPVTWFYRMSHRRPAKGPVRGPTLMKAVLERASLRHYLLGGTPRLLDDLQAAISQRFPQAEVVGHHAPAFRTPTADDIDDFAKRIRESGAEIVWVGLGTPKQDEVIAALLPKVNAVLIGVGAAFDFISGHKMEAPTLLQESGMEWLYRFLQEPRRLWRRYLVGNTLFIAHVLRQLVRPAQSPAIGAPPSGNIETVPRVTIGGAEVHCLDEPTAIDLVLGAASGDRDRPWLVVTPNIQHIALLEVDHELRQAYRRADLVLADGWPVVRAVRMLTRHRLERITGADLLPAVSAEAASLGLRIGIVGGMNGAAQEAAARLSARYPGLQVGLTLEPPLGFERRRDQVEAIVDQVRSARLDLLFLALGTPKQEKFAASHIEEVGVGVTLCVGAAVDFVAGRQRRAPRLMRRFGFEWAYRAIHEPRRLLPRYIRSAPVFMRAVSRTRREHRRNLARR